MRFITKHSQNIIPQKKQVVVKRENNEKKEVVMDKISMVEEILNEVPDKKVKKLRKDKGLIERTESSTIVLTEDNKQLLVD